MRDNRFSPPGAKPGPDLNGRKILIGVTGGIAAYKAVELTRLLIKAGARVQVVMTEAATKFVTPLTFEAITARTVFVKMFPEQGDLSPWHTELASWPDLTVIAPATANHLAKLAMGLADDLLSTLMLTLDRPRLLCPAMNHRMWLNPATQENLATLKGRGFRFLMPDEGPMARPGEGDGVGRLAEPAQILREIQRILSVPQDLRGVRVLVTAGRTEESWDPVRVLTNRASGRMGFALAEEALEHGAEVVLIHGPTDVIPPSGTRIRRVTTAAEMSAAVKQEFPASKIVLMSAAVADYTFATTAEHKIKKGAPNPEMRLVATEDILRSLSGMKGNRIVVGFALETENLLENALRKLREKHLDIVVANNPLAPGSGFSGDTNQVLLIHRSGRVQELPLQSKREVAREILQAVIEIYRHPEPVMDIIEEKDEPEIPEDDETLDAEVVLPPPAEKTPPPRPVVRVFDHRNKDRRPHEPRGEQKPDRRPPPKPRPTPEPKPEVKIETKPEPVPIVAESAAPVSMEAAAAELPFPSGTPAAPKKSGRTRRGGRRSARARAKRAEREMDSTGGSAAIAADAKPASPPPPHEPKPVVVSAPVVESIPVADAPKKRGRKPSATRRPPAPKKTKKPAADVE